MNGGLQTRLGLLLLNEGSELTLRGSRKQRRTVSRALLTVYSSLVQAYLSSEIELLGAGLLLRCGHG